MAKWHFGRAPKEMGLTGVEFFEKSGPLVSIAREPPQNSTDNPLPDSGKPVRMRYSIREIDHPLVRNYFPQNPWVDHISSGKNHDVVSLDDIASVIDGNPIPVLVIEDFNTTGIVGDPYQHEADWKSNDIEYTDSTMNNTYYWFARALAATKPKTGRGGSWGLGKLASPLSSTVRTFFCVTNQHDTGKRFLMGQSVVNQHTRHGKLYEHEMFYGQDDLQEDGNFYSWKPVSDDEEIEEFCRIFGVDRESPGTSFVIPFPKEHEFGSVTEISQIVQCIIANWAVPIIDGDLEVEFEGPNVKGNVNSTNLRSVIESGRLSWEGIPEKIGGKENPAWTSTPRLRELLNLSDARSKEDIATIRVKTPSTANNYRRSPYAQISELIPEVEDEQFVKTREIFHQGGYIRVTGKMPVWDKDEKGRPRKSLGEGHYDLILHKTDQESAEAHFYRDQISLPLVNKKKPVWAGVSSLMEVTGHDNPLAQMLRDSEGPAHLFWDAAEPKFQKKFHHGVRTITFLKELGGTIARNFEQTESDSEALWDDIFNFAGGGSSRTTEQEKVEVDRNLRISELDQNGFSMVARSGAPDLTGNVYILRVGYPMPFAGKFPDKAPDPRSINIHDMQWFSQGAELDVLTANDGEICHDRFQVTITESDFCVEMTGLDSKLKAQVVAELYDEVIE